jgi:uncharacterized membrane protein (DUF485 family)
MFFLAYYITLPVMTSYFDVLNREAVGAITWAWIFAFSQFIMTWILCYLYTRKSVEFDALSEELKRQVQHNKEEG